MSTIVIHDSPSFFNVVGAIRTHPSNKSPKRPAFLSAKASHDQRRLGSGLSRRPRRGQMQHLGTLDTLLALDPYPVTRPGRIDQLTRRWLEAQCRQRHRVPSRLKFDMQELRHTDGLPGHIGLQTETDVANIGCRTRHRSHGRDVQPAGHRQPDPKEAQDGWSEGKYDN